MAKKNKDDKADSYIYIAKFKGHVTWRIVGINKSIEKLEKHVKNECKGKIEAFAIWKLNGLTGEIGIAKEL